MIAAPTLWPQPDGEPVSCREKLRMLAENHAELAQTLQDAFDDAILMGVDETAMRRILTDLGVDSQYQWITPNQAYSLQASYFHESQHWGASYPLGATANLNDGLDTETLTASYLAYQAFGATESFTNITGTGDAVTAMPCSMPPLPLAETRTASPIPRASRRSWITIHSTAADRNFFAGPMRSSSSRARSIRNSTDWRATMTGADAQPPPMMCSSQEFGSFFSFGIEGQRLV